jgi:hypothetical protein
MGMSKVCISLVLLAAMSACLVVLTGCGTTYGTVYISHPQVFTRERLVVERDRELQFLSKSLDAPVTTTFQGAIDTRQLTAFQNSLALTVSPTAGTTAPATATPPALIDASKLMPGGADSMDTAKAVSLTSEQQFQDILAYRDTVNAVIREKELDDAHDRDGKTLYTLKFDTALIPGDRSWRPAVVKLNISPKFDASEIKDTYRLWMQQLNERRSEEENTLDGRLYRGQISSADEALIIYLKAGLDDYCAIAKDKIEDVQLMNKYIKYGKMAANKTADWISETPDVRRADIANVITNTDQRDFLFTGMEMALNGKYCHDFAGFASIDYTFDQFATNDTVATCQMVPYKSTLDSKSHWLAKTEWRDQSDSKGQDHFAEVLNNWGTNCYVDSIDPQMYAQNISDVSSEAKLLQLALAVSAAIGKPASLSDTMNYTQESQKFLQAIKRQPLAMSFNSGSDFGWFLGPQFEIKDGEAQFRQTPIRQSFSVSIVVPAWVKNLTVTGTQSWIEKDGTSSNTKVVPPNGVVLLRDMDALSSAIQGRSSRLAPKIYLSGQLLQVATNGDQTLLIQGRELWRNPAIFVGSTAANAVDLLPNMQGVVAHFKSIPSIYEGLADLTVVTSFGADTLEKSIHILSTVKTATETNSLPLAKLTNSFAVNGGQPLGFALTGMPSAFAGLSIKLNTREAPGKWQDLADTDYKFGTNRTSVAIPIAITNPPLPSTPTVYTVELGFRNAPFATPQSLMPGTNQPSFVYFPQKDQEKLVVTAVTINYTPDVATPPIALSPVALVTKTNFFQAYPGLEKAVTDGTATFTLLQKATNTKSQPLPIKDAAGTGWSVNTAALTAVNLPSAQFDIFTVEYQMSGTQTTIECTGGPVTVTGH